MVPLYTVIKNHCYGVENILESMENLSVGRVLINHSFNTILGIINIHYYQVARKPKSLTTILQEA